MKNRIDGRHRTGYARFEPWNGLTSWWVVVNYAGALFPGEPLRPRYVQNVRNTEEVLRNRRRVRPTVMATLLSIRALLLRPANLVKPHRSSCRPLPDGKRTPLALPITPEDARAVTSAGRRERERSPPPLVVRWNLTVDVPDLDREPAVGRDPHHAEVEEARPGGIGALPARVEFDRPERP